jgi:hypothetical protein
MRIKERKRQNKDGDATGVRSMGRGSRREGKQNEEEAAAA